MQTFNNNNADSFETGVNPINMDELFGDESTPSAVIPGGDKYAYGQQYGQQYGDPEPPGESQFASPAYDPQFINKQHPLPTTGHYNPYLNYDQLYDPSQSFEEPQYGQQGFPPQYGTQQQAFEPHFGAAQQAYGQQKSLPAQQQQYGQQSSSALPRQQRYGQSTHEQQRTPGAAAGSVPTSQNAPKKSAKKSAKSATKNTVQFGEDGSDFMPTSSAQKASKNRVSKRAPKKKKTVRKPVYFSDDDLGDFNAPPVHAAPEVSKGRTSRKGHKKVVAGPDLPEDDNASIQRVPKNRTPIKEPEKTVPAPPIPGEDEFNQASYAPAPKAAQTSRKEPKKTVPAPPFSENEEIDQEDDAPKSRVPREAPKKIDIAAAFSDDDDELNQSDYASIASILKSTQKRVSKKAPEKLVKALTQPESDQTDYTIITSPVASPDAASGDCSKTYLKFLEDHLSWTILRLASVCVGLCRFDRASDAEGLSQFAVDFFSKEMWDIALQHYMTAQGGDDIDSMKACMADCTGAFKLYNHAIAEKLQDAVIMAGMWYQRPKEVQE